MHPRQEKLVKAHDLTHLLIEIVRMKIKWLNSSVGLNPAKIGAEWL